MIDVLKEIIALATESIEHQKFHASERAMQGGMTLAEAINKIPTGFYVRCETERGDGEDEGDEGDEAYLCATLYENTPEGGWPNARHPSDKFRDRLLVSITASPDDLESFERFTVGMITSRWP